MLHRRLVSIGCLCLAIASDATAAEPRLGAQPADILLLGHGATQQLVIAWHEDDSREPRRWTDVTRRATYESARGDIARVDEHGCVTAVANGVAEISAQLDGRDVRVRVEVRDADTTPPVSFELDVEPILTARGCNMGACHGKSRGQNGFQLSLLGFDADFDYFSLTQQARGRRVFPADPARSLLLQKGTARVPHGGGLRLPLDGPDHETLSRWIASGMPRRVTAEPTLTGVSLFPTERAMVPHDEQQLIVTAHYSNGTSRDVTRRATFQSNEAAIIAVDAAGLMRAGPIPGEATIMARFMGHIATCSVAIPLPGSVPDDLYEQLPRTSFIDELVWAKLKSLGITPSPPADDARFLRRVSWDIIGRLPTPDETRAFLADASSQKRVQLVDSLLDRTEYADHWASKWADLLRPNPYRVGIKAVLNYDQWIRDRFRRNQRYDQFVRELVTAQGSTWRNGATTLFRDRREPEEIATLVSQLFLGVRLECAKCHHHPFERWSQEDFYSFAAYFARVGRKGTGLSPPISGGQEFVFTASSGAVRHPLSGKELAPRALFGESRAIGEGVDPREVLADWMTSEENPYFTQVIVNRVWADLMGRGLVDPVDDLRATNPPSNAPLLDRLAREFRREQFDLKRLIRLITTSHVYSLSSEPTDRNVADTRNYSRHYRQRPRAEVLLDAISDITETRETFSAMPAESRASQIWTHRVDSVFLDTFGRPDPNRDPPCERMADSAVTQVLHLMNAPNLHAKVTADQGRAARLAASDAPVDAILDELYLLVYCRFPAADEREVGRAVFSTEGTTRRQATEDLLWALLNTPEFLFRD